MTQDHGDPKAPRSRGEAFWRRTLAEQRHSGLTQLEFCRRHDLPRSTFQRWRRRLEKSCAAAAEPEPPEFVSVEIRPQPEPAEPSDGFELIFQSGLRLKLPRRVEGQALVEVLRALEVTGSC